MLNNNFTDKDKFNILANLERLVKYSDMSSISNRQKWSSEFRNSFQEIEVNSLEEGATALMYACQQENVHQLRNILKKKPNSIRDRDRTLKTVLHYCAENVSLECAEIILNAGPDLLDIADEDGYTALHLAVIAGNVSMVKFLISRAADINKCDSERHSVIHWATVCGEADLLEVLFKSGANPTTPDIHGGYPVHYAAQMCGVKSELRNDYHLGMAVLKVLLAHSVNVSVMDHDGRQPLLWAASAGSSDAVLELINAGASLQAFDKDGLTALHCAASRGHTECLETLVELCAADVDTADSNGCTALFYSVTLGHADATHLLLGYGSNPNRQDRKGRTAAHCGAVKGQLETLKILKKKGADLWMRNAKGDYPLQEAVCSGRKELVRWLLPQRPEAVNASNLDGRCPLHIAAMNNNIEMCKILLDYDSLVNPVMRTSKGDLMTPLDVALNRSNRGCAKYLQLHGGVPASKLTSTSAALRGPHRVEAHSDHYATSPDFGIDCDSKLIRCSRSLNTSPYSTLTHSTMNSKLQVHILADLSSETRENGGNTGIEYTTELSTKRYKKKINKKHLEKQTDENTRKQKEKLRVSSTDDESSNSDEYVEYSTENEHKQRRKYRKDRRKTNGKTRTRKILKFKSNKNIRNQSSHDSDTPDENTGVGSSSKTIHKDSLRIREVELENIGGKKWEDMNQAHSGDKKPDVPLEKVKNDKQIETTDSGGRNDSIEYHQLENYTDTEGKGRKKSVEVQNETEKVNRVKRSTSVCLEDEVKTSETNSIETDVFGQHEVKTSETNSIETDVFGQQPFLNSGVLKSLVDTKGNLGEKVGSEKKDAAKPNKKVVLVVDDKDKKNIDEKFSENLLENEKNENDEVMKQNLDEKHQKNIENKSIQNGDENDKKNSENKEQNENTNKCEKILKEEEEENSLQMLDQIQEEVKKSEDKIFEKADESEEKLSENLEVNQKTGEDANKNVKFVEQDSLLKNEKKLLVENTDKSNGKEKNSENGGSCNSEGKGLVCVLTDYDGDVGSGLDDFYSDSDKLKHKKRSKSAADRRRSSRSSFEILSDNENGKILSSQHDDSGFEPSPKHSNVPSEGSFKSSKSRIPRAKKRVAPEIKKDTEEPNPDINVTSVTQAVQTGIRKYHLERRIFNTLLDLKRLQIRSGKANEQVLVKRLIDDYQKAGLIVGLQQYDGVYSFKHFERYLYNQLRLIQSSNKKLIPRIKSTDDLERLTKALKQTKAGKTLLENIPPENPLFCTHGTHRCIHATHAYTGIPCAAYIAKLNHHQFPKGTNETYRCFLPRIDIVKRQQSQVGKPRSKSVDASKTINNVDPSKPVTLELIHGAEKQSISLPTDKLDKNKRYCVTFTINGNQKDSKKS